MKADSNRIRRYLDSQVVSAGEPREESVEKPLNEPASPTGNRQCEDDVTLDCTPQRAYDCTEDDDDTELADILDQHLQQLENGTPVSAEDLIAQYPQHERELREYLDGLELINVGIVEMTDSPIRFDDDEHRILGDFELIREIGRGGMGVVYEARQISLDRRVALKVLPFAAMLDQRQIVRFETEARAAARLQHPHIVPVYGVGCDRAVHYYAMQFIEGSSIRELIDSASNQHVEVTPRDAARLGLQAASALCTAHGCGIVHRDIKPSNLLLDAQNDLWIADFGLARSQSDSNVTQSGDVLGTLHYMSPEQARGNSSTADPRSDIYSLGVTLYELLTRTRPFDGGSPGEVLQQIEQGHTRSIRSYNSEVPRDLENVVAKAMSLSPNDRYQSAAELEADLDRFMEGRATLAKPPSILQKITRWGSRNRALVASVLLIAGIAVTCSSFWLAGERADLAAKHKTADNKLQTTETSFEQFGLATVERLKQIPGSESARKALLADLLTHYEDLLGVSANDPSLREDRAITCTKIANIYRESGELQQAVIAYQDAEKDFRSLAADVADSSNLHAMSLLARCLSNESVVSRQIGELDVAVSKAHEAIDIQKNILAKEAVPTSMMDLAASYANLAAVEFSHGNDGIPSLNLAQTIAEQARQLCSNEDRPKVLKSLSTIYGGLSSHQRQTDIHDAIGFAQRAVACSRELLSISEDNSKNEFRPLHALNCNNLASLLTTQNNHASAIHLYRMAAQEFERIEQYDQLVLTLCNLAKIETLSGESLASANTYAKAITVQSSLLLESPGNLNHVSRLGGLHNNRALALQKLGRYEHACIAYESAVEYQQRAYQLAPKKERYYRDALSRTFFNAGKASMEAGKPHQSANLQLRRSKLWPNDAKQLFSVARNIAAAIHIAFQMETRIVKFG